MRDDANAESGDAISIYQNVMDTYCELLQQDRMDEVTNLFHLPYLLRFNDGKREVIDREHARGIVLRCRSNMIDRGADKLTISTQQALFHTPDLIEGFHTTHLTGRGVAKCAPFLVRVELRRIDGWVASGIEMMLDSHAWPVAGITANAPPSSGG